MPTDRRATRAAAARRRARRPAIAGLALSGLIGTSWLAGCANTLQTRPLATDGPGVAAYELSGTDLRALRAEAVRLCGGPADVLRESTGGNGAPQASGLLDRWWTAARQFVDPPMREAQLVVRCDLRPEAARVNLADAAAAVPEGAGHGASSRRSTPTVRVTTVRQSGGRTAGAAPVAPYGY